jgi:hypothetical protein
MGESVHPGELPRPHHTLNPESAPSLDGEESGLTVPVAEHLRWVKRMAGPRASAGSEEVAEQRAALGFENPPSDLDAMVEAGIAYDVPE